MNEIINKAQKRMDREQRTIRAMIELYCMHQHHPLNNQLCMDCQNLLDYAMLRINKCPFQSNKPTCAKCPIHCYKPTMQEKIRQVMRFSGPRMTIYHPIMALSHLLDGIIPLKITERRIKNIK